MIQRRSARYVTYRYHNTSSVETMLQKLQWPTLEERRMKARLTLLYKIANGNWKLILAINCYHLINSPGTPTPNLSRYNHARPASGKSPSIQKRLQTGTTYPPQWSPQKVLTRSRNYCLHINFKSDVFICTCIFYKKKCISQTSFVTLGLFEYASAHQIQYGYEFGCEWIKSRVH